MEFGVTLLQHSVNKLVLAQSLKTHIRQKNLNIN